MKYMYLLLAIPSIAFAQVDTRIIDTVQSRGNPPMGGVVHEQPPRRMEPVLPETPQPPRNINRSLPLPMDQYWSSQRPLRDDCFNTPPQFRTVCMDIGMSRNRSINFRPRNNTLRQQIRRATPQQRRAIQQSRKEFQQKVRRILKK
jgi:hypothetical protein